jgi:hypothetical protein
MKNDKIVTNTKVNPLFEEVLEMTDAEFRNWIIYMRKEVVRLWDEEGLPPRVGFSDEEMIENFRSMIKDHSLHWMETVDLQTGKKDVIRNTSIAGNAVNDYFPTMMKTRITYGKNVADSRSIYDYFAREDLLESFITYATRHFKRDSFYHYSTPLSYGDVLFGQSVESAEQAISLFRENSNNTLRFFFCPVKDDKEYTGFNTELKKKKNITVSEAEMKKLSYDKHVSTNVDFSKWKTYTIRTYELGQRLFPKGLKAFRVSFCQYAVNFPPLTARYLYERYCDIHKQSGVPIIIYDPSAGWGGRLLGAMSVNTSRQVLYVGTDPNTDHTTETGETKYQNFARFFNHNVREQSNSLFKETAYGHAYHIFQSGSETIGSHPDFQSYKGRVDLVFTSPPYFAKEVYSEDDEQSCHKFSKYDGWRDGFLRPTLETAVEWLKPGGYLLWNVSDIVMAGVEHPLVQDSIDILKSLGMVHEETLKLAMAQMPGGNRLEETGEFEDVIEHSLTETTVVKKPIVKGKMKYFCEVKKESGKGTLYLKYEPVLVFHKPL